MEFNTKSITDIFQKPHIDRCFQQLLLHGVCICNYKNDLLREDRVMTAINSWGSVLCIADVYGISSTVFLGEGRRNQ
jgi:hypothetical protein